MLQVAILFYIASLGFRCVNWDIILLSFTWF